MDLKEFLGWVLGVDTYRYMINVVLITAFFFKSHHYHTAISLTKSSTFA